MKSNISILPILAIFAVVVFQTLEIRAAETPGVSAPYEVALSAKGAFGAASVSCTSNEPTVFTGVIERKWKWMGRGLPSR